MFIKYSCPVCGGVHTIKTGAAEAIQVLDGAILDATSRFASSVLKALRQDAKQLIKEGRAQGIGAQMSARELKKAVAELMNLHPKTQFARIHGLVAASPKMLGALIVKHADGKKSYLIAESGSPDIFTGGDGKFDGWRVANVYIQDGLSSLFATKTLDRASLFPAMSEEDFRTNCAAMKLLLAVANDRKQVRDGKRNLRFLSSDAPIRSLDLSEILYRPVGVDLTDGFKKYTSSYDRGAETHVLEDDFLTGKDEEIEMQEEHFARPCDRCRLKAPAIICPIEVKSRRSRFAEAESFKD